MHLTRFAAAFLCSLLVAIPALGGAAVSANTGLGMHNVSGPAGCGPYGQGARCGDEVVSESRGQGTVDGVAPGGPNHAVLKYEAIDPNGNC